MASTISLFCNYLFPRIDKFEKYNLRSTEHVYLETLQRNGICHFKTFAYFYRKDLLNLLENLVSQNSNS